MRPHWRTFAVAAAVLLPSCNAASPPPNSQPVAAETPPITFSHAPSSPKKAHPTPPKSAIVAAPALAATTQAVTAAIPHGPGGPATFPPVRPGVLSGKVVVVDPGHNGANFTAPATIDSLVWNGRGPEACDTTGTATDSGYPEALFNWRVAQYLTADLRMRGATVVLTRTSNNGVGPCITQRAAIGNAAHADVAVSIHADGGPPWGRGFSILTPVADGVNNAIIGPSDLFARDLRAAFASGTGEPVSNYYGIDGIQPRDNLAGTNLSTVPKVFIECANMRNSTDASLVVSPAWQQKAAASIAAGITTFLS